MMYFIDVKLIMFYLQIGFIFIFVISIGNSDYFYYDIYNLVFFELFFFELFLMYKFMQILI